MEIELEVKQTWIKDALSRKSERYEQNRNHYVSSACDVLESEFGLSLTMGQRMLVRQQVVSSILAHRKVEKFANSFDPDYEGIVEFISLYYPGLPIRDVSSVARRLSDKEIKRHICRECSARDRNYE